jgi:hypothetical protein
VTRRGSSHVFRTGIEVMRLMFAQHLATMAWFVIQTEVGEDDKEPGNRWVGFIVTSAALPRSVRFPRQLLGSRCE